MKGKKNTREETLRDVGTKKTATRSVLMMSRVGGWKQRKVHFKTRKERKIEGEKRKKKTGSMKGSSYVIRCSVITSGSLKTTERVERIPM